MASAYVAGLVTLDYDPVVRISTFDENVRVDSRTFAGGGVVRIGRIETAKGTPDRRLTLTLSATTQAELSRYLTDRGPIGVTVEFMASSDGSTWTLLPKKHVGVQSAIVVSGGTAEMTVETAKGTVWAGRPLTMTDAVQRARFPTPTPDKGFEYAERFRLEGVLEHPPG